MAGSKSDFQRANETLEQRKARLQKHAKELEDALRKPPAPRPQLVPKGQLRRDGDAYARNSINQRRQDVMQDLEKAKAEIKARDARKQNMAKTKDRSR